MKRFSLFILIAISLPILFTSCQKVIDIDLNSSDPRLVVEGRVSSENSMAIVELSYSVNFDEDNIFPPAENAIVKITDSDGVVTTLSDSVTTVDPETGQTVSYYNPGVYSANLIGVVGKTYHLTIVDKGVTYTASSYLGPPVPLDTIYVSNTGGFNPPDASPYFISCEFDDPADTLNYYRFVQIAFNEGKTFVDRAIFVGDDNLQNGSHIIASLFGGEYFLKNGDTVRVEMQMIDEGVCEYFTSLAQLTQEGGGSAVPTNPKTNIEGGALGYFSAYSSVYKELIVAE